MICSSRLRNCRGIELSSRDFKTVAISVTRAKAKNCRAYRGIELSRRDLKTVAISVTRAKPKNCRRGIELSRRDLKTVAISVTRAKPKNCRPYRAYRAYRETVEVSNYRGGTSKLLQYRSLEQSYTVLTHGLHVRALALRHSPLQAT